MKKEKAEIEARHRAALKSSVAFEKRIRNRWREKNARIAKFDTRVRELERGLAEGGRMTASGPT